MEKRIIMVGKDAGHELHDFLMEQLKAINELSKPEPQTNLESLMRTFEVAATEDFTVFKNGEKNSQNYVVIENKSQLAFNVGVEDEYVYACSCNERLGIVCKHMVHVALTQRLNLHDLPK